jgi:hypothetical protein
VSSAFAYSGANESFAKRGDSTIRNRRVVATSALPVTSSSSAATTAARMPSTVAGVWSSVRSPAFSRSAR